MHNTNKSIWRRLPGGAHVATPSAAKTFFQRLENPCRIFSNHWKLRENMLPAGNAKTCLRDQFLNFRSAHRRTNPDEEPAAQRAKNCNRLTGHSARISKIPPEYFSRRSASIFNALVITPSKFASLNLSSAVPKPDAFATGFHKSPSR